MKFNKRFQSIEHGVDTENWELINLTEEDSLEAWHNKQAEQERESQAFYATARARLRSAFESGLLRRELSAQQLDILVLLFNQGKTTNEIAQILGCGVDNVDHQLVKLFKKLNKLFK